MRTSNEQRQRRRELDDVLDEALKQTFPASDPFSIGQFTATEPPLRPVDRRAPRIEPHQAGARRRRRRRTA